MGGLTAGGPLGGEACPGGEGGDEGDGGYSRAWRLGPGRLVVQRSAISCDAVEQPKRRPVCVPSESSGDAGAMCARCPKHLCCDDSWKICVLWDWCRRVGLPRRHRPSTRCELPLPCRLSLLLRNLDEDVDAEFGVGALYIKPWNPHCLSAQHGRNAAP